MDDDKEKHVAELRSMIQSLYFQISDLEDDIGEVRRNITLTKAELSKLGVDPDFE